MQGPISVKWQLDLCRFLVSHRLFYISNYLEFYLKVI